MANKLQWPEGIVAKLGQSPASVVRMLNVVNGFMRQVTICYQFKNSADVSICLLRNVC